MELQAKAAFEARYARSAGLNFNTLFDTPDPCFLGWSSEDALRAAINDFFKDKKDKDTNFDIKETEFEALESYLANLSTKWYYENCPNWKISKKNFVQPNFFAPPKDWYDQSFGGKIMKRDDYVVKIFTKVLPKYGQYICSDVK